MKECDILEDQNIFRPLLHILKVVKTPQFLPQDLRPCKHWTRWLRMRQDWKLNYWSLWPQCLPNATFYAWRQLEFRCRPSCGVWNCRRVRMAVTVMGCSSATPAAVELPRRSAALLDLTTDSSRSSPLFGRQKQHEECRLGPTYLTYCRGDVVTRTVSFAMALLH